MMSEMYDCKCWDDGFFKVVRSASFVPKFGRDTVPGDPTQPTIMRHTPSEVGLVRMVLVEENVLASPFVLGVPGLVLISNRFPLEPEDPPTRRA